MEIKASDLQQAVKASSQVNAVKEFRDSAQAGDFFSDIYRKLHDKRNDDWARATDEMGGGAKAVDALKKARQAWDAFLDELEKAAE